MDQDANVIQTFQNQITQLHNQFANTPNLEQNVRQLQQQIASANAAYQQIAAANNNISINSNLKADKPEVFSGTNVLSWLKSIENVHKRLHMSSKKSSTP